MSHLLPRFNQAMQRIADAEKIGRILQETGDPGPTATVARATLPGDTRRLRGIPVVGFSVSGTSPGTDPANQKWMDSIRPPGYHPDQQ